MNKKIAGFLIMLGIIGFGLSILPGSNEATYIRTDEMKAVLETDTSTAAIKVGIDSLITLAHESWSTVKVHDALDLTANDTTMIVTGWDVSDGGVIQLITYSQSVADTGTGPTISFKMVMDGRWMQLYFIYDGVGPVSSLEIGTTTKSYKFVLGFHASNEGGEQANRVFGDSIMAIIAGSDCTAGTQEMWGWSIKDYK